MLCNPPLLAGSAQVEYRQLPGAGLGHESMVDQLSTKLLHVLRAANTSIWHEFEGGSSTIPASCQPLQPSMPEIRIRTPVRSPGDSGVKLVPGWQVVVSLFSTQASSRNQEIPQRIDVVWNQGSPVSQRTDCCRIRARCPNWVLGYRSASSPYCWIISERSPTRCDSSARNAFSKES